MGVKSRFSIISITQNTHTITSHSAGSDAKLPLDLCSFSHQHFLNEDIYSSFWILPLAPRFPASRATSLYPEDWESQVNTWQEGSSGSCDSTLAQSGSNHSLSGPAVSGVFHCRAPKCSGQAEVRSQASEQVPFIYWCLESTDWYTRYYAELGNERKRHNDNFSFQFSVQEPWPSVHGQFSWTDDCILLWCPYLKLLDY